MTTILLLLGSILVLAIGVMIYQLSHTPDGYETEEGFEFGPESATKRQSRVIVKAKSVHHSAHGISTHIPAI